MSLGKSHSPKAPQSTKNSIHQNQNPWSSPPIPKIYLSRIKPSNRYKKKRTILSGVVHSGKWAVGKMRCQGKWTWENVPKSRSSSRFHYTNFDKINDFYWFLEERWNVYYTTQTWFQLSALATENYESKALQEKLSSRLLLWYRVRFENNGIIHIPICILGNYTYQFISFLIWVIKFPIN